MESLFDHEVKYGIHYCSSCDHTYREGKHFELYLLMDRRIDPSSEPSKKFHVSDFCPKCWQSWIGYEIGAIDWMLKSHDLQEYVNYVHR